MESLKKLSTTRIQGHSHMDLAVMKEIMDIAPAINVLESEYKRLLGYPSDYILQEQVRDLMNATIRWYAENGKPWIYARQAEILEITDGRLKVDETEFTSKRIHDQLIDAQAENAVMVAVSAGRSLEEKARQLWKEEKPDEYFFMEVYGSAVVEHLIATTGARLCEWGDQQKMAILPHYSPGYPGWDISNQAGLLKLILQKKRYDFPEEIHVLESGMLHPKKSLLALFGITPHLERAQRLTTLIPCENCSILSCQYRRVPYKHPQPQIEDVRRLQSQGREDLNRTVRNDSALDPDAKYSINLRALEKWSRDRLQLKFLDDRSVEARFRYEGTTCSNMGRTLEFDYHVRLGSSAVGYTIIDAYCAPAPGDTGHKFMCQYLEDADSFMNAITNDKPLLGRPLRDVLTWRREYTPSGCYCGVASREYKWGIVLEVIHYALVQREIQSAYDKRRASSISR